MHAYWLPAKMQAWKGRYKVDINIHYTCFEIFLAPCYIEVQVLFLFAVQLEAFVLPSIPATL